MCIKNTDQITEFLNHAVKLVKDGDSILKANLNNTHKRGDFLFLDGLFLSTGENYYILRRKALTSLRKSISENAITDAELENILDASAIKKVKGKNVNSNTVRTEVKQTIAHELIYVCPNFAIRLDSDIDEFDIGPVKVIQTCKLHEKYPDYFGGIKIKPAVSKFGINVKNKTLKLPPFSFMFKLRCSWASAPLLADYYGEIALSLLRFYMLDTETVHSDFPEHQDPLLFRPRLMQHEGYVFNVADNASRGGGWTYRGPYWLTHEYTKKISETNFADICEKIFYPPKNSVAQILQLALSWLTKARISDSPVEKIMFIFTALEAMLTNGKAEVSETIARYISFLITDRPYRYELYKHVKVLYNLRSKVIHKGFNNISHYDANVAQLYAEAVYAELSKQYLNLSINDFYEILTRASLEGEWPHAKGNTDLSL